MKHNIHETTESDWDKNSSIDVWKYKDKRVHKDQDGGSIHWGQNDENRFQMI